MQLVQTEAGREARLRRLAERNGLALRKSRARTWRLDDQCGYMLVNEYRNVVVCGHRFDLTLDEVDAYLSAD
jgi:hypothetical protein